MSFRSLMPLTWFLLACSGDDDAAPSGDDDDAPLGDDDDTPTGDDDDDLPAASGTTGDTGPTVPTTLTAPSVVYGLPNVDNTYDFATPNPDDDDIEWQNSSGKSHEFEVAPPDNMQLWRLAATGIGRWMGLLRRASERVYAPGGVGAEAACREFETLALQ